MNPRVLLLSCCPLLLPLAGCNDDPTRPDRPSPALQSSELCSDHSANAVATFEDAKLEAAVRVALSVGPEDDLTCGLVSGLTSLYATRLDVNRVGPLSLMGIQNLTGLTDLSLGLNSLRDISLLSGLTALTRLELFNNQITDVSALSGLTSLTSLSLQFNAGLSNVQPLLENPGLELGDTVNLGNTAVGRSDLALLVAKGMMVLPMSLSRSYLVGGYLGSSYSDAVASATGGRGDYVYALTAGELPTGLSLNSSTGAITGTTASAGMSFFEITASSAGIDATSFYSITVSTNPPSGFNMWGVAGVRGIPTAAFKERLNAVLARWEAIVISDVADIVLGSGASSACGLESGLIDDAFVDDVLMLINITSIDRAGPYLGSARTCWSSMSAPFPIVGSLTLDSYEISAETVTGQDLFSLIWHELGHAMGISAAGWNQFSYLVDAGGVDPKYVGPGAVLEYRLLSNASAVHVAVENRGSEGTRDAHWRESVFLTEAMTGSLDRGVRNPISRMTIRALEDLGWGVDVNQADPYALPGCTGTCYVAPSKMGRAQSWELLWDLPAGTQERRR